MLKANGPLGEERFSFDPAHNLLSKSDAQSSHYTPDNTLPSGVSKVVGNLLKRISGYHFDYDARGNLTRKESHKGIQTFSWDAHNQLTRSTSFSSATEPKLCTDYLYDVFGRRIAKRVVDEHRHTVIEQTLYDWEGLTIASEERIGQQLGKHAANPGRDWQNAPALALNVQYLYEDGQFVPLAQYINSSDGQAELLSSRVWQAELAEETQAAPKLYHYVCDHLGTPQLLMNQGQDVVWEAKAKAWGETRVMSRSATDEQVINNHRFQGQYYDAETSLHYNTFRYYDPELGRFISQDPIGLMGGINLYQYAPNPVEWVDPLGWKGVNIITKPGVFKNQRYDVVMELSRSVYPETFTHIEDAIKAGHAQVVTIGGKTSANRRASLKGIETKLGLDRDEWPMAMFKEGGEGASVRHIDPSDNRGAGASIGCATRGLSENTRILVQIVD